MVQQIQKSGSISSKSQYVKVTVNAKNEKPMVISFPKGTHIITAKEKSYDVKTPFSINVSDKDYKAFQKADATKDGIINGADAKKLLQKGVAPKGVTATPFGINVMTGGDSRVGTFFPGYIHYNQTHSDEE